MKKILSYISKSGKLFTVKLDHYDTCFIECENFIDEIPAWQEPGLDIALLLAKNPVKKLIYVIPTFDIEPDHLDAAFDEISDNENSIENFIKTLVKITAECDAESIIDYLENEYML